MLRKVKTVEVLCTVVTEKGETSAVKARVAVNKINELLGNGLTGKMLYDLKKLGKAETTDQHGNKFVYEIVPESEKSVQATEVATMNESKKVDEVQK